MAFWTKAAITDRDPKRNFRFRVLIGGIQDEVNNSVWWAKKVTKPNYTVAESKHVYLGHTFYYPGKVEWQAISMTLVDPVSPGSLNRLNKVITQSGYVIPGNANMLRTQSKGQAVGALGNVVIEQLGADGIPVETWTLQRPFLKSVKFSDLDYENDDLSTIDIELRYDWAVCLTADGNTSAQSSFNPVAGS